jgi:protein-S-isoprenylcysteine O-methyltransferase Ste14
MSRSANRGPLPPTSFLGAVVVLAALHVWLPARMVVPRPWNLLGLVLAADRLFKTSGTTVKPFEEPSVLVTDGVFRWTRNPMYLGFVVVLLGIGILAGSATALLPWIAFGILMDRAFIRSEEATLSARFPREWKAYRSRVRRWV